MGERPVNILAVMNESFADLESLTPFGATGPVWENLRALSGAGLHGRLNVSVFGGGTGATEFEFLTGHSLAFLPAECAPYVQYLQPSRRNGYSLAWLLKEQGYEAVAVHPAEPGNWNRSNAYALLGFDRFLSLRDMGGWDEPSNNLRGMYTDEALYGELLRLLREKPRGQRLFVHCVTIQNHGGYLHAPLDGEDLFGLSADIPPGDGQEDAEIGNYLTLAAASDRALGGFVRALEEVEEPTLLLFFGDHHPTVSRPLTKRTEGADRWDAGPEARAELFQTPLLIWSNRALPAMDIGDTSAQYLGPLLTQVAGLELSDYQSLLGALRARWPVFTAQAAVDSSGRFYPPGEAIGQSRELRDYRAVQYNLLLDDRHKLYAYPNGE
jgi:hypothetical protein